jgi:hypothetical protein
MSEVYVVFFNSKTWQEIGGVYSSQELADEAIKKFMQTQSGTSGLSAMTIKRRLDE